MPIPPFFKSPVFIVGSGCAGTGGLGIVGGQAVEEYYPSGDRTLRKKGFRGSPPPSKPNLGSDTSQAKQVTGSNLRFDFKTYDCFVTFFPGQSINWTEVSGDATSDLFDLEEAKKDITSDKIPFGCAMMDFSYKSDDEFIFKSEVTVKNDKFGWALGTGIHKFLGLESNGQQTKTTSLFTYQLVFLKKKGESGDTLGGYLWYDACFTNLGQACSLRIIVP